MCRIAGRTAVQVTGKLKRYGNIGLFADGETIVQVTGKLKRCGDIGLSYGQED